MPLRQDIVVKQSNVNHTENAEAGSCMNQDSKYRSTTVSSNLAATKNVCQLFLIAVLVLGDAWVYDTPGAIYTSLKAQFGQSYSLSRNQILYSVYNWPNVILGLVGGLLIDVWLGLKSSTALLIVLVFTGQLLFSISVELRVYALAVVGRLVYGLGGEALKVAQNTWIVQCSLDSSANMSLRFGLVLGLSRLAGAINFAITPIAAAKSVSLAVWLGTIINLISVVAAGLLIYSPKLQGAGIPSTAPYLNLESASCSSNLCSNIASQFRVIRKILVSFPLQIWLQFSICVFYHVGVLLLYQVASAFLQNAGPFYSERTASLIVSISAFIAVPGTPLAGWLTDKYGNALWSILVACVLLSGTHILLILSVLNLIDNSGSVGMWVYISAFVLAGISYSMATAVIWPLVPFLLPRSQLATGYGVMSSVENLGLAVMPLVLSALQERKEIQQTPFKYALPLIILAVTSFAAALLVVGQIWIDNKHYGSRLNKPARYRTILL